MKYNTAENVELRRDVIDNIGYANYEHEMFELSITISTLDSNFNRNQVLVEQLLHSQPLNYVDVLNLNSIVYDVIHDIWKAYHEQMVDVSIETDEPRSQSFFRKRDLLKELRDRIEDLMTHTNSLGLEIDEEGNIENRLPRETQLTAYNSLAS